MKLAAPLTDWLTDHLQVWAAMSFFNVENFHFDSSSHQMQCTSRLSQIIWLCYLRTDSRLTDLLTVYLTLCCWYRWLVSWPAQDEQRWTKADRTTWDIYEKFPWRSRSRSDQEQCLWTSRAGTAHFSPRFLLTTFPRSYSAFCSLLWSFVEMCSCASVFTGKKPWRQRQTISLWVWLWQICCWQFWFYPCLSMQR